MKRKRGLNRKTPLKRTRLERKRRKHDKPEVRWEYALTHQACCLCGARVGSFGTHLEAHHILGGRFGRVDDERNLAMLCGRLGCSGHALAEGERLRGASGAFLPRLKLEHVLWLKQEMGELDREFLQSLMGKRILPEPEELPASLLALRKGR